MGGYAVLTHVKLKNFSSFLDAEVDLSPVTLVIGANGSGKSNFLQAFATLPRMEGKPYPISMDDGKSANGWFNKGKYFPHFNHPDEDVEIAYSTHESLLFCRLTNASKGPGFESYIETEAKSVSLSSKLFSPQNKSISQVEAVLSFAEVAESGSGTTQVLHDMKNGANEARFLQLKERLIEYIPEIENLSFTFPQIGKVAWQVSEKGIKQPVPGSSLSEGTRIVVFLLAILYQENPPNLILLEDIDHGMHPRLFEKLISLFKRMSEDHGVQIIATTHNPYLVSCFEEDLKAVVVVEKENGNSTLRTLEDAVEDLDYDPDDPESLPLGELWFSGYAGGVPSPSPV